VNADNLIKPVRITDRAVYIGGLELPGAIEEGGVIVKPGGVKNINRLTVTFLVGEVDIDGSSLTQGDNA
jgi:hypothetical protein